LSAHTVEYAVLKRYLDDNRGQYEVEEGEDDIVITFTPTSPNAKGWLGSSTFVKIVGRKVGGQVEIVKQTVIEGDESREVDVDSLDGWLDFVKNAY